MYSAPLGNKFAQIHGHAVHGAQTPTYFSWQHMNDRCYNSNHAFYKDYGGRGISVCERWRKSFTNFLDDMGERPSKLHTIDRIDGNGNYEPDNCRWATRKEQARNRKTNRLIAFNGVTRTLAEWSELTGINREKISWRIDHGWPIEKAMKNAD